MKAASKQELAAVATELFSPLLEKFTQDFEKKLLTAESLLLHKANETLEIKDELLKKVKEIETAQAKAANTLNETVKYVEKNTKSLIELQEIAARQTSEKVCCIEEEVKQAKQIADTAGKTAFLLEKSAKQEKIEVKKIKEEIDLAARNAHKQVVSLRKLAVEDIEKAVKNQTKQLEAYSKTVAGQGDSYIKDLRTTVKEALAIMQNISNAKRDIELKVETLAEVMAFLKSQKDG